MDNSDRQKPLSLGERIRTRREALQWSQAELAEKASLIAGHAHSLSPSTIKAMERIGGNEWPLPRKKWGRGESKLELVAMALDVPFGYLLEARSKEEILSSRYGQAFREGRIELVSELQQPPRNKTSFRDFLKSLPTTELKLFELPLHSYVNQFAFAIIFRVERFFPGREMLIVNEPPLIFWDTEDLQLWIQNMDLTSEDAGIFREEFVSYRRHFRKLVDEKAKRYKVVLNLSTFKKFIERKSPAARRLMIDDMCLFLKRSTFNMVLYETTSPISECEVLCKQQIIPASLEGTISIQIVQTPPHQRPGFYFVSPAPKAMALIQREISRIEDAWAAALDQYSRSLNIPAFSKALSDAAIRNHTTFLLKSL